MNKYKKIDSELNYKFLKYRQKCAKNAGYSYISEHVVKTYREKKSLRATGKECGGIGPMSVSKILTACKEPIKKPGGKTWGKLEEEHLSLIRSYKYMNTKIYKKVAKIISKDISKKTNDDISVAWQTIKNVWIKKTYNEQHT